jgi:catechol 2,3-dioxygenase-like lactoylglutathione lyase family enzyme
MSNRAIAERGGVSRNGVGLPDRKALRHWFQPPKGSALKEKGAGISRTGNAAAVPRIDGEQANACAEGCGYTRTGNAVALPRIDGEQANACAEGETVALPVLGSIAQISRTVSDIQKAERWYGDVLGLRHLYTFGNLAFFDCGGTRLFLSQEGPSAASESILYFRVDDIEAAHKSLAGKGVEFTNAPHLVHRHADGTEEWMAVFKDLEGRPLAIMAQVKR